MALAQTAPPAANGDGVEVLTRGPIHEAFAETVVFDPQPGITVPQAPPELIEEIQPDQRPAGDNVAWIPGYWGWDEEQNDYLWISGVWRKLPPGREWVPGYWSKVDTGHQWTAGYWQDAQAPEVTYLPEPPRSVEAGPNIAASSDEQTWIPGTWQYREERYAWRAGHWVEARQNWCWIPSYYRWTPYGHVYVDGYWDYPVVNRGVVFAPVRFRRDYCEQPGFHYSPVTAIVLSVFSNHLFVRPNYCHYYFGDYYDVGYRNRYYASHDYGWRNRGFDPIFAYNRWENRLDRNWFSDRQRDYHYRRDNEFARPPRTWAALNQLSLQDRAQAGYVLAERYDRMVENRNDEGRRFQQVSASEREQFASKSKEIRSFGRERMQRETSADRATAGRTSRSEASRMKVDHSPVAASREIRAEKNGGPPARVERRIPERGNIATSERTDDQASKSGRNAADLETRNARRTDRRDVKGTAANADQPSRETRTQPGQRRELPTAAERNPQPSANATNTRSDDRTKTSRRGEPSVTSKGNVKSGSDDTAQPQRKSAQPEEKPQSTRQSAPGREATPPTRQTPQRQATPQRQVAPQRHEAPQRQAAPKRQEIPQRQAVPQRQAAPQEVPRQAAPQRQEVPQRQAAPQRQEVPKNDESDERTGGKRGN